ncbi:hypothetical protein SGFS_037720 [Streptomyces graminofaciens]|uniref:Uncharacterized protein n=1 Tax=Streptomyces graminofaciens TaxID=68212 RepID=A0ABN5VHI6_9ACTN|nr:hypothetical protein SGFS_037720 [Streptomyces graminofaciens]
MEIGSGPLTRSIDHQQYTPLAVGDSTSSHEQENGKGTDQVSSDTKQDDAVATATFTPPWLAPRSLITRKGVATRVASRGVSPPLDHRTSLALSRGGVSEA